MGFFFSWLMNYYRFFITDCVSSDNVQVRTVIVLAWSQPRCSFSFLNPLESILHPSTCTMFLEVQLLTTQLSIKTAPPSSLWVDKLFCSPKLENKRSSIWWMGLKISLQHLLSNPNGLSRSSFARFILFMRSKGMDFLWWLLWKPVCLSSISASSIKDFSILHIFSTFPNGIWYSGNSKIGALAYLTAFPCIVDINYLHFHIRNHILMHYNGKKFVDTRHAIKTGTHNVIVCKRTILNKSQKVIMLKIVIPDGDEF